VRYADEQDLAGDGMTAEERGKYRSLSREIEVLRNHRERIKDVRLWSGLLCPAAVPALERAEANVVTAIEEVRRDLALMMGDET